MIQIQCTHRSKRKTIRILQKIMFVFSFVFFLVVFILPFLKNPEGDGISYDNYLFSLEEVAVCGGWWWWCLLKKGRWKINGENCDVFLVTILISFFGEVRLLLLDVAALWKTNSVYDCWQLCEWNRFLLKALSLSLEALASSHKLHIYVWAPP